MRNGHIRVCCCIVCELPRLSVCGKISPVSPFPVGSRPAVVRASVWMHRDVVVRSSLRMHKAIRVSPRCIYNFEVNIYRMLHGSSGQTLRFSREPAKRGRRLEPLIGPMPNHSPLAHTMLHLPNGQTPTHNRREVCLAIAQDARSNSYMPSPHFHLSARLVGMELHEKACP